MMLTETDPNEQPTQVLLVMQHVNPKGRYYFGIRYMEALLGELESILSKYEH